MRHDLAFWVMEVRYWPAVCVSGTPSVSMVKASNKDQRWRLILKYLSDFASKLLKLMDEVFQSKYTTARGTRGILFPGILKYFYRKWYYFI